VRITGMDLLTLDLHASLVARLDDVQPEAAADDGADDDEAQAATPLSLAIDLGDTAEPTPPATPSV
jgi:exoribonuclease-2